MNLLVGGQVTGSNETFSTNIENNTNQNKKIPEWVKNIFVWYAENKVSEEELLGAIEFLIKQNIIQIRVT